ncbi:MAG: HlyD family efflux transporter periplasmic adaptor subunit [Pirellulales bacterium]
MANTHVGQFLPSGTAIASLQSIDDFVFVDFMVPQTTAESVKAGMNVDLTIHDEPVQKRRSTRSIPARQSHTHRN